MKRIIIYSLIAHTLIHYNNSFCMLLARPIIRIPKTVRGLHVKLTPEQRLKVIETSEKISLDSDQIIARNTRLITLLQGQTSVARHVKKYSEENIKILKEKNVDLYELHDLERHVDLYIHLEAQLQNKE